MCRFFPLLFLFFFFCFLILHLRVLALLVVGGGSVDGLESVVNTLRRASRGLLDDRGLRAVDALLDDNDAADRGLGGTSLLDAETRVQLVLGITQQLDVGQILLGVEFLVGAGTIAGQTVDSVAETTELSGAVAERAGLGGAARGGGWGKC